MEIIAKSSFVHGSTTFKRGATVEVAGSTGSALLNAGLVREATKADEKPAAKTATKRTAKTVSTENVADT